MKIAVLSGKGGTGKTFVSINLAASAASAVYLDCDVEEPNGYLFWQPEIHQTETINTLLPSFDSEKCTHCRKCMDFCRFNALAFVGQQPKLFSTVCHSCGGCALLCPAQAISEVAHPVGVVESGSHAQVKVSTGILNLGEASGVPVIKAVLRHADDADLAIIDCPPGSACTVMESVHEADYCILVAEPTAFGLHNFQMVYELVRLLGKPCGVIINKVEGPRTPLDDFCQAHDLTILARLPYSDELARLGAHAEIAAEHNPKYKTLFGEILHTVHEEALL